MAPAAVPRTTAAAPATPAAPAEAPGAEVDKAALASRLDATPQGLGRRPGVSSVP